MSNGECIGSGLLRHKSPLRKYQKEQLLLTNSIIGKDQSIRFLSLTRFRTVLVTSESPSRPSKRTIIRHIQRQEEDCKYVRK
eukprot:CAMPEP_0181039680 /NCGR_PEP_ID=MMETSP1070-20121207/10617_1 /TAXON_ID=265543 /ORGANISM="Minutocellus polymorphus, Strain NH13" /LENGTH=81 /DNA_ID=CAMNT_0023117585 /DNA_START=210 /DNA_END=452 /DNA_ORIENTATION=+